MRLLTGVRLRTALRAGGLLCVVAMGASAGLHAQVAVIANDSIEATEISRAQLRDVFTGAVSTLKGGEQVIPVLLKAGTVHEDFLSMYVGKSDAAFRAGWRSLLFSGQSAMPHSFENDADVVEYVARTHGAIGYIARGSAHAGVKTLVVR